MTYRHDKKLAARLRYARLRQQAAVEDVDYLNDAEYEDIRDYVAELRRTGHLQPTKAAGLELRLKSAIPDARVRKRLLDGAHAKDPTRSASELVELVLESYERDRR
jgi:hypothetical protein